MVKSLNSKVDLTIKSNSYRGMPTHGDVIIGDMAFEFYNDKNPNDYYQIPWSEIDHISASVIFGKWISRFAIFTKKDGYFTFSTRDNKETLRAVRKHFDENKMFRAESIADFINKKLNISRNKK